MNIETPAIVINRTVMRQNIKRMAEIARQNRVELRPHVKTHKIPAFALEQIAAGAVGVTVAKIAEAEVMAEHGVKDIFIAYPIVVPSKIARVIKLARLVKMSVGVDSLVGARQLSAAAEEAGVLLDIRLEIDTGLKRTGVVPEDALSLSKSIQALPGLNLNGVFTYKGAMYQGQSTLDLEAAGEEEGRLMVAVAEELRTNGIPIEHVSVGSSPSAASVAKVKGITEIRPGTYIFYDRMQTKLGVSTLQDCAARVVVTVVSISPELVVVDGGSKTFATDVQPNQAPLNLRGFGEVIGYPEAVLERMNEEHGMIRMNTPHQLQIGDIIEIVPNHICSTVNLHNAVYVEDEHGIESMTVLGRGKLE
ncbi:amino acid aldolase [Paenibacillus albiflavus]|uniref:Amino acid aldolase n=1 Tax=Paenibacillus albiflavus TaxID=2545760 RepID=A0A4R4EE30_9BACL|nr:alanine racemase [Paenibacillus albiflavus]TCZ77473.1 amino acid aldolase [Paenibacillus albiflavus]